MRALICAMLLTVLAGAAEAADAGLYLYPRAERGEAPLAIADIAKIEAEADTASRIGAIVIKDALYEDGYLDRKEILDAIKEATEGRIAVYGSGVRVVRGAAVSAALAGEARKIVKTGSPVRFQVVNSLVRVELMGTAMQDGAAGEVIPVKIKGGTVSRGVILNERTVELKL